MTKFPASSLLQIFAKAMAAMFLCFVQKLVAIPSSQFESEQIILMQNWNS